MKNKSDIYALLDRGSAKRRTAETLLNKQSSRSHSVFCITVRSQRIPLLGVPSLQCSWHAATALSGHAIGGGRWEEYSKVDVRCCAVGAHEGDVPRG